MRILMRDIRPALERRRRSVSSFGAAELEQDGTVLARGVVHGDDGQHCVSRVLAIRR